MHQSTSLLHLKIFLSRKCLFCKLDVKAPSRWLPSKVESVSKAQAVWSSCTEISFCLLGTDGQCTPGVNPWLGTMQEWAHTLLELCGIMSNAVSLSFLPFLASFISAAAPEPKKALGYTWEFLLPLFNPDLASLV